MLPSWPCRTSPREPPPTWRPSACSTARIACASPGDRVPLTRAEQVEAEAIIEQAQTEHRQEVYRLKSEIAALREQAASQDEIYEVLVKRFGSEGAAAEALREFVFGKAQAPVEVHV